MSRSGARSRRREGLAPPRRSCDPRHRRLAASVGAAASRLDARPSPEGGGSNLSQYDEATWPDVGCSTRWWSWPEFGGFNLVLRPAEGKRRSVAGVAIVDWELLVSFGIVLANQGRAAKALRMFEAASASDEIGQTMAELRPLLALLSESVRQYEEQLQSLRAEFPSIAPGEFAVDKDWRGKRIAVDGARCHFHACSTAENYLDRGCSKLFGSLDDRDRIGHVMQYLVELGVGELSEPEETECCYCDAVNQVGRPLINDWADFDCHACGESLTLWVIQLNAILAGCGKTPCEAMGWYPLDWG